MSTLDRLLDTLRVTLPGALDSAIKEELWNCTDEFCRHTDAYRVKQDIALAPGQTVYPVAVPGAVVLRVYNVTHPAIAMREVRYDRDLGEVILSAIPEAEQAATPLTLTLSLAPTPDEPDYTQWLPEGLWARYYPVFLDGTMGRMHGQAAKPYSAQQKAAYHLSRFRRKMAEARHDASVNGAPSGQTWRFPRFAR